jgi:hypothetical protein
MLVRGNWKLIHDLRRDDESCTIWRRSARAPPVRPAATSRRRSHAAATNGSTFSSPAALGAARRRHQTRLDRAAAAHELGRVAVARATLRAA